MEVLVIVRQFNGLTFALLLTRLAGHFTCNIQHTLLVHLKTAAASGSLVSDKLKTDDSNWYSDY